MGFLSTAPPVVITSMYVMEELLTLSSVSARVKVTQDRMRSCSFTYNQSINQSIKL